MTDTSAAGQSSESAAAESVELFANLCPSAYEALCRYERKWQSTPFAKLQFEDHLPGARTLARHEATITTPVRIPDTVLFEKGLPLDWIHTDKRNLVRKRFNDADDSTVLESILDQFTSLSPEEREEFPLLSGKGIKPRARIMPECPVTAVFWRLLDPPPRTASPRSSSPVACHFMSGPELKAFITTCYMNNLQHESHMTEATGILQMYVPPAQGKQLQCIRADYSTTSKRILSMTICKNTVEAVSDLATNTIAATFEDVKVKAKHPEQKHSESTESEEAPVSVTSRPLDPNSRVAQQVAMQVTELVRRFHKVRFQAVRSATPLSFYFQLGYDHNLYFLRCSPCDTPAPSATPPGLDRAPSRGSPRVGACHNCRSKLNCSYVLKLESIASSVFEHNLPIPHVIQSISHADITRSEVETRLREDENFARHLFEVCEICLDGWLEPGKAPTLSRATDVDDDSADEYEESRPTTPSSAFSNTSSSEQHCLPLRFRHRSKSRPLPPVMSARVRPHIVESSPHIGVITDRVKWFGTSPYLTGMKVKDWSADLGKRSAGKKNRAKKSKKPSETVVLPEPWH